MLKEFSILDVADRLGLQPAQKMGKENVYRCPFCGDSTKHPQKGHLYINGDSNTYYCHRCGQKGNTVTLWAIARGVGTKEAYKELCNAVEPEKISYPCTKIRNNQTSQASLEKRNSVYRSFLQELPLYPRHKQSLLERGLDENVINNNTYKSVPDTAEERWKISNTLIQKGLILGNIPGFFTRGKYWDFYSPPGYFIPVKNADGNIQGLQIRAETYDVQVCTKPKVSYVFSNGTKKALAWVEAILDGQSVFISGVDKNYKTVMYDLRNEATVIAKKSIINGYTVLHLYGLENGKYRWFSSSGMPNGTPAKLYAHYANQPNDGKLWLTEGPLKADVASHLIGAPFVGLPGISSWKAVHPILDGLKPKLPFLKKEIVVALDSDVKTKPYLLNSLQDFIKELKGNGFKPINADWSPGAGNGIDDVLLKITKNELREVNFTLNGVPVNVKSKTSTTIRVG